MRRSRVNPLLSRLGCITTLMIVLTLGIALHQFGGTPFSPGELSAASPRGTPLSGYETHASFGGECGLCHVPWQGASADRCLSCHLSIGEEQRRQTGMHGLLPDTGRCTQCHNEHQGPSADITSYELSQFEHDWLTSYSLVGHTVTSINPPILCQDCHQDHLFDATTVNCKACHQALHPEDMSKHRSLFGDGCLDCHDGLDSMMAFDHVQVFPLTGGHTDLACAACHLASALQGTDRACSACHAEPKVHAGAFGLTCDRCHTADAWLPAQLREHRFPLEHGGEGKIPCQVCHTLSYTAYSCTNCHAHPIDEIREIHTEEGIVDFLDCVTCHPTGREDEPE